MNLQAITGGIVSVVNPTQQLAVQISKGYVTAPDGSRSESYFPTQIFPGQVQPLAYKDLIQTDGIAMNGLKNVILIQGNVEGIVRPDKSGGDLITDESGKVWLVVLVMEHWPDWTKVAVVLQNGA